MANGIRDLKVWQEAVALAGEVIRALRPHTRRETKTFSDQIMATAAAVATAIAEGYGRHTEPEQRQRFRLARDALLRLETELAVARRADLLPAPAQAELSHRIQTVNRLLGGYLVYLDRQVSPAARGGAD